MSKSAQAFRTIREVADWLDVAAHVLRFWESKFTQIKPVKRAGGRRYYRPADMELVGGIKVLLHDRGLTIRGVQKMIADEGVEAVTALSPPIDELVGDGDIVEMDPADAWEEDTAAEADAPQDEPEAPVPDEPPAEDTPLPEEVTAEPEAPTPSSIQLPGSDPAEGHLGALTALTQLAPDQRARLTPQIAALARLRDRMAAPPDAR